MEGLEITLLVLYAACLVFLFLYSAVQLHLTVLYRHYRKRPKKEPAPLHQWPTVTVQLPLYNEVYVAERLLRAVAALDYPRELLQILVLDDSTDETVALVAREVEKGQRQGLSIQQVRRPDRTGYKAGALQHALPLSTGEFIVLFDADFLPAPDFLRQALPYFTSARVGVVQTRWGHLNRSFSLLTQLQAFGLDAHFTVEQGARNKGHHFINFNGTAGIWRKKTILEAGGWHADTLTEDLDLSYRAQLQGWEFRYVEHIAVPAELPVTMPALRSQQYRWTKGAAETARKHLWQVLRSDKPWLSKWFAFFHLLNSSVFVAVLVAALLSVPVMLVQDRYPVVVHLLGYSSVFKVSFLILGFFYWTAERHLYSGTLSGWTFPVRFFYFLVMSLGLSLHNALAVLEGFLGRKTPFVRTPKFNLAPQQKGNWRLNQYSLSKVPPLAWLEGLLCLYFLFAVGVGVVRQTYGFLPYHLMLSLGFGLVFFYTWRHSK
ncbi:glycosyltransferase [Rufibacter glacialis]|uniref:Glycosyltransferase n=1 Tax=Rufibacter glacialis TaxID=1259555 RepID=A0A5M8QDQ4_9BACT|nr:glycosyltransferase [Rufibacter glacialis]KAA6432552.1 glycosyltransferase [Rufibacter glacialis]GGK79744.1 glucosyltransferase [Rufibacter glacialis]